VWDESYRGKGLKVLDVLKRGPADKAGLNLKPGEYVLAIDGVEVTEATDPEQAASTGKVGETIDLRVAADPNADPKARRAAGGAGRLPQRTPRRRTTAWPRACGR